MESLDMDQLHNPVCLGWMRSSVDHSVSDFLCNISLQKTKHTKHYWSLIMWLPWLAWLGLGFSCLVLSWFLIIALFVQNAQNVEFELWTCWKQADQSNGRDSVADKSHLGSEHECLALPDCPHFCVVSIVTVHLYLNWFLLVSFLVQVLLPVP